jgi:hypothetical protein
MYLSTSFDYYPSTIDNGAELIDLIGSRLLTQNWTEDGTGSDIYKSPIDAVGRWFRIAMSTPSVDKIQFSVDGYHGLIFNARRLGTIGVGEQVRLYSGPLHFFIEKSTTHWFGAGLLDHSPDAQDSHQLDAWVMGNLDGSDVGTVDTTHAFQAINGGPPSVVDDSATVARAIFAGGATFPGYTISGVRKWWPHEILYYDTAAAIRFRGKIYQCLQVSDTEAVGAQIPVPVDEAGTPGAFRVSNITAANGVKLAWRIA